MALIMAGSLLWKCLSMVSFPDEVLRKIREYSLDSRGEEMCGVIFNYEQQYFFPMKNIRRSVSTFTASPELYFLREKISAVVHSHPYSDAYPSPADRASSRGSGIPFLIYSCLYNNFLYFDCSKCNPVKE